MTLTQVSTDTLDRILAIQFLVAWAGEGQCEPRRLGWWRTDVVDDLGGGDFFKRLAPRTHRWASLEAARRAAFMADARARHQMPDADHVRTLFFWGFELDERLTERIRDLKLSETETADGSVERLDPYRHLPFPEGARPDAEFARSKLEVALKSLAPDATYQSLPTGRQVKTAMPADPASAAGMLAACLVPFSDSYLPPFIRR